MRILRLCIAAAAIMALVAVGFAHASIDNAGTTAANFLSIGAGPRILSMGGATLGLGDDVAAGAWNVAALGWTSQTEYVLSHSGLENESIQEWAAVGGRFGESATRWAVTGLYQGDGSFEGRDASNNPTGDFTASSMAFGAQVAHRVGGLTVGLGAKSVMERLGDVSGFGFTFDGGVMYRVGNYGAGLSATNLGGQMKYGDAIYSFPANYGVGLGYTHPRLGLRFAVDANFPKAYYSDVRLGAEWVHRDMVAVRMGYRHEMSDQPDVLSGPTFGLGAGHNGLWFDYGYLISGQGESQHRIGLKYTPGAPRSLGATNTAGRTVERARAATAPPKPAAAKPAAPAAPVPTSTAKAGTPVQGPQPTKNADGGKTAVAATTTTAAAKTSTPEPVKPAPEPAKTAVAPPLPAPKMATATPEPVKPTPVAATPAPQKTATPEPVKTAAPATTTAAPKTEPVASNEVAKAAPAVAAPAPEPVKAPAPEPVKPTPEPAKSEPVKVAPEKVEAAPVQVEKAAPEEKAEKRPDKVKVKGKETLADIAKRWKTTPAAIMMENNLTSDRVKPGQTLKLPPPGR